MPRPTGRNVGGGRVSCITCARGAPDPVLNRALAISARYCAGRPVATASPGSAGDGSRALTETPSVLDPHTSALDPHVADHPRLRALLGASADELDLFDRVQLEAVLEVCASSASLSEAGRRLFDQSLARRTTKNDADRLRKYLARFGLEWGAVHPAAGETGPPTSTSSCPPEDEHEDVSPRAPARTGDRQL